MKQKLVHLAGIAAMYCLFFLAFSVSAFAQDKVIEGKVIDNTGQQKTHL